MLAVNQCVHLFFGKRWFVLIIWQVMSALLTGINVINTLLADRNGSTLPFLQLCISYTLLLVVHIWRYEKSDMSWIPYIIVSVFNIGGDTAAIYAYDNTSLSSAMLLATTTIFWVTPLSFFFLKRKYSLVQLFSMVIGFGGVIMIFIADGVGESRWLGNLCAFLSAFAYAIANVIQEKLVYSASATLYLCRFSIFASPISGIFAGAIEHAKIRNYDWNSLTYVFIFVYSFFLAVYYTAIPFIMQFSNATEMNISLLSGNFFSLLISILAFGQKAQWLYLVGFFMIPIAIVLYTLFPYKEKKLNSELNTAENQEKEPMPADGSDNFSIQSSNNSSNENKEEDVEI